METIIRICSGNDNFDHSKQPSNNWYGARRIAWLNDVISITTSIPLMTVKKIRYLLVLKSTFRLKSDGIRACIASLYFIVHL